jgi:hypothetical protein
LLVVNIYRDGRGLTTCFIPYLWRMHAPDKGTHTTRNWKRLKHIVWITDTKSKIPGSDKTISAKDGQSSESLKRPVNIQEHPTCNYRSSSGEEPGHR